MKLTHYLYISAAITLLTACSEEEGLPSVNNQEAETPQAIELAAGIVQGDYSGVETRASGVEDHHGKHVLMDENSLMRLLVVGDWWKTAEAATVVPQMTIGKAGEVYVDGVEETEDTHRKLTLSPVLNWDDYGTADPNNMGTGKGRVRGLAIYGVTVAGVTAEDKLPEWTPISSGNSLATNWNELAWTLPADQSTSGWANKDLLISNNVQEQTSDSDTEHDGRYKFDDKTSGKLLEFRHAMSKITVRLIASDGFPTTGVGATTTKFAATPEVKLTSNMTGQSNPEWVYTSGKVNIETGAVADQTSPGVITMRTQSITDNTYTVIYDALIMPGSVFENKGSGASDPYPTIASINADGNIYYITSEKIRAKIKTLIDQSKHNSEYMAEPGKNYIITVNVKKTKIEVTATVRNWDEVDAETVTPVINVTASYGESVTGGNAFNKSFDLFRSTTIDKDYDDNSTVVGIDYASRYTYSGSTGSWSNVIFWPNHSTHYFFRGVYPTTGTESFGLTSSSTLKVSTNSSKEVIAVENVEYKTETWPSDLMIALPRTTNDPCAHSKKPLESGICATTGTITMNFEYAMSKVEMRLKSSASTESDYVDLTTVSVEIVGGYNKGRIALKDGLHDTWVDTSDKGDYTLHNLSPSVDGFKQTTRDAIIPQELSDDAKLKITVTNSDGTTDVYYAQLNEIKGKKAGADDSTKAKITEWKHGEYYIYELTITKTQVHATATLTDWVTVTASEDIWF